jgi:hypothetical protein
MGAMTSPLTSPARPRAALSRRTVLAAGAGGVTTLLAGASGCSVNNPFSSAQTPAREAVRDLAPDVGVAVEAVTAIRATEQLVEAVVRRHPRLRGRFQGLLDMHAAHLRRLVDAVPERVDTSAAENPPPVLAGQDAAREQVLDAERRLHDRLAGLAMRAQSGAFARLLGSVAASISQHVVASSGHHVGVRP